MTPEQKNLLMKSCEEGNDVQIVTLALQIAAFHARKNNQKDAIAIRAMVDSHQSKEAKEVAYRRLRLEIVKCLVTGRGIINDNDLKIIFSDAENIIKINAEKAVPEEKSTGIDSLGYLRND